MRTGHCGGLLFGLCAAVALCPGPAMAGRQGPIRTVPRPEVLAGTWQHVRTCNPGGAKAPCAAEAESGRLCADFGCCWDPEAALCYKSNDQTVPSQKGVERYAANQALPTIGNGLGQVQVANDGDILGVSWCVLAAPSAEGVYLAMAADECWRCPQRLLSSARSDL